MKQKYKKILSVVLTVCMLTMMMPQVNIVANAADGTAYSDGAGLYSDAACTNNLKYTSSDYKDKITKIIIGDNVETIGFGAFNGCVNLTTIVWPENLTSIGETAFQNCSSLTTINLPNTLNSIGNNAFMECEALSSITIPNSVTTIGDSAFCNCYGLETVKIESDITSIGIGLFNNCRKLTTINIPNGVTSIGYNAFKGCYVLEEIAIPYKVESIGEYAFTSCLALKSIDILNKNTTIEQDAFGGDTITIYSYPGSKAKDYSETGTTHKNLYDVTFDLNGGTQTDTTPLEQTAVREGSTPTAPTVTKDGTTLVWDPEVVAASGDEQAITYTAKVPEITAYYNGSGLYKDEACTKEITMSDDDFDYKQTITEIVFKGAVTSIGNEAFYSCSSLTSIDIPSTVTSIGQNAFQQSGLTSITIPNSVTSIGAFAFASCYNLKSGIDITNKNTTIGPGAFDLVSIIIYSYPGSKAKDYTQDSVYHQNLYDVTFDLNGGTQADDDTTPLEQVVRESSTPTAPTVTKDGTTLVWNPEVVAASGDEQAITYKAKSSEITAYYNGSGLYKDKECTAGNIIDKSNKEYRNTITKIEFIGTVTTIGEDAFSNCTSLTEINIPENVTTIGINAFFYCESLESIVLPDKLTTIESMAFYLCTGLKDVNIPDSVKELDSYAFYGCSSLKSIDLPSDITAIYMNTFYGCSSLISIDIPDKVIGIVKGAFKNCSKLESITIPDSVSSIGNDAFYGCTSLKSIDIPNKKATISIRAFQNDTITIYSYPGSEAKKYKTNYENGTITHKNLYDVTFDLNGGTQGDGDTTPLTQVVREDSTPTAPTVTKDGNTLSWDPELAAASGDTQAITYTAVWNEVTAYYNGTYNKLYKDKDCNTEIGRDSDEDKEYRKTIKKIEFIGDITLIDDWAFCNCTGLTSIDIPSTVGSIGQFVFCECTALKSIDIPSTVGSIGQYTFAGCTSLKSIDILNKDTTIISGTFNNDTIIIYSYPGSKAKKYTTSLENGTITHKNLYDVAFDLNGGTQSKNDKTSLTQVVREDDTATAPTVEKSGYKLSWSPEITGVKANTTYKAVWTAKGPSNPGTPSEPSTPSTPSTPSDSSTKTDEKTITVIETPKGIENPKLINVEENGNAFDESVEVRLKDAPEVKEAIKTAFKEKAISDNVKVFPLDISMYIKGTDTKVQPKVGTSVTITCPIPTEMLENKDDIVVVCIVDGKLQVLSVKIILKDDVYCAEFTASHFSPYAFAIDKNGELTAYKQSVDDEAVANQDTDNKKEQESNPITGDEYPVLWIMFSLVAVTIAFISKKKCKLN